jgi:hypothetical protein
VEARYLKVTNAAEELVFGLGKGKFSVGGVVIG